MDVNVPSGQALGLVLWFYVASGAGLLWHYSRSDEPLEDGSVRGWDR